MRSFLYQASILKRLSFPDRNTRPTENNPFLTLHHETKFDRREIQLVKYSRYKINMNKETNIISAQGKKWTF